MGLGLKATAAMFSVLLIVSGIFYWYYKDSQEAIAILNQNNATLETAVTISEETISNLQRGQAAINVELEFVNKEFQAARLQNNVLRDKLERHEIGVLALAKPGLVERVVNNATAKAGRCFEILSGSELTETEKNADSGRQFNSECSWLWSEK